MKEPLSRRLGHERGAFCTAAALAEDHHARWIATELSNVVAHPLQSKHEIELACIAGVLKALARQ